MARSSEARVRTLRIASGRSAATVAVSFCWTVVDAGREGLVWALAWGGTKVVACR